MQWTSLNDLREKFLTFFESKGHMRFESASLVPLEDVSLLLINSGMAPLKKYFLGVEQPPSKRAASCQKCIRTPDIERVGKTSRHGTYFEMLGNFSFGDYFKREAASWAWEFITETLGLPVDRLWVSIYVDDDEAFDIWTKEVGVSPDRIVRLGKADNFWEIGAGPCGPCSELYFDCGERYSCGSPSCAVGCDCDRYVEFWNLVFTQYNSDGAGNYTPLDHPNIDTGMGLERLACIMQGVDNLFEVDAVRNIMSNICEIAGVTYKAREITDVSLRVITDHIRSTVFMIGDGILPQNEGRGYILRRLLRRASRHGLLLGVREPFLYKLCDSVIKENEAAYPALSENSGYIKKVMRNEEERFLRTLEQGMEMLMARLDNIEASSITQGNRILSGSEAFKLHDTFGFPLDLIKEITAEKDIAVDEAEFSELMEAQRRRARDARVKTGFVGWKDDLLAGIESSQNEFVGYEQLHSESVIKAIVCDNRLENNLYAGDHGVIILDITPFYAESGGQAGDMGIISLSGGTFHVHDCKKSPWGHTLHIGVLNDGMLSVGDAVSARVDADRRNAIMRNHSAAHLLQKALMDVLGSHVHQSGSMVDDERCRFDFTHFSAMTTDEIQKTESAVNNLIFEALPVTTSVDDIASAKKMGAIALFNEKYGSMVRVVSMGSESIELCGGTHVRNTSMLGLFKIVSESSVAAGIRRIEAVTGNGVLKLLAKANETLHQSARNLKVNGPQELLQKTEALAAELKARDNELESLTKKLSERTLESAISANTTDAGGIKLVVTELKNETAESMRMMADIVKSKNSPVAAVLYSIIGGKYTVMTACSKTAQESGCNAGAIVKRICGMFGGSGGGRPDSAMGGFPCADADSGKLKDLPRLVRDIIEKI